ncbi:hypothetical protein [Aliikangiella sp. G2MR2-5]|uniref:hypothetical protein n=1 Tax=Aliikangiella sp. G2MR2-5 TaxID=2788943 RepID=UPI0018A9A8DF|nr:hypothetical protein [Aliikangiella sp. G2MR2-5]
MPKAKRNKNRRANLRRGLSESQLGASTIQVTIESRPRNPFSDHPLMRKGGVHQKSKSAERSKARRETKRLARDWSFFKAA